MNNIINPLTGQRYSIFEFSGRELLKKYIISYKNQGGGEECKTPEEILRNIKNDTTDKSNWSNTQSALVGPPHLKCNEETALKRKTLRENMIVEFIKELNRRLDKPLSADLPSVNSKLKELGIELKADILGSDKITSDKDVNITFQIDNITTVINKGPEEIPDIYNDLVDIINCLINNYGTLDPTMNEEKIIDVDCKKELDINNFLNMSKKLDVNFYFPTLLFKFKDLDMLNKECYLKFIKDSEEDEEKVQEKPKSIFFIPILDTDTKEEFIQDELKKVVVNDETFDAGKCLDIQGYNLSFRTDLLSTYLRNVNKNEQWFNFNTKQNLQGNDCDNIKQIYPDENLSIGYCVQYLLTECNKKEITDIDGGIDKWNKMIKYTQKSTHIASEQYQTISSFLLAVCFIQILKANIEDYEKLNPGKLGLLKTFAIVALFEQLVFYLNHHQNNKYFGRAVLCYLILDHDRIDNDLIKIGKNEISNALLLELFEQVEKIAKEFKDKYKSDPIRHAGDRDTITAFIENGFVTKLNDIVNKEEDVEGKYDEGEYDEGEYDDEGKCSEGKCDD